MAGHSKWANIKHKKSREDSKRGKVFTKIIREITVAAREGGGDPDGNPRLRLLIEKARAANMPQENYVRAIKKGTGEIEGAQYESSVYEGYGPGGIAILVETLSDNKNRTVADVRHAFSKRSGNMAESGSVSWMFEQKGVVRIKVDEALTEDDLFERLIDLDIDDIESSEEAFQVYCDKTSLAHVKAGIESEGFKVEDASIAWVPKDELKLENELDEEKAIRLLEALEDLDDVQDVYTNLG